MEGGVAVGEQVAVVELAAVTGMVVVQAVVSR